MTNYTKTTDFAAKDSLPSGNAAKIVKGSEIDTEFNNIATASATKANANNAALTGTTTAQTLDISGNVDVDGTLETDALSLNGVTVTSTAAELNYVDGVTSNIQTQLDTKAPLASPTFTGTVTVPGLTTTANVLFGDNDKAIFGAGSDLQIYHDGSNSYVDDQGAGALFLKTNGTGVFLYAGSEALATFNLNGASNLYYDNGLKLSTTSTGIDVTGSVTADGLTVSNSSLQVKLEELDGTNNPRLVTYFDSSGTHLQHTWSSNASNLIFEVGGSEGSGTERMRIDASGNVGIGSSSPSSYLAEGSNLVIADSSHSGITLASGASSEGGIFFADGTSGSDRFRGVIRYNHASNYMEFRTDAGERMRIDSSGNLLVGTDSNSSSVAGVTAGNSGLITACRSSNYSGIFNRLTSDGDIVQFRKDGTTVGSLLTNGNRLAFIATRNGVSAGIDFEADNRALRPVDGAGDSSDNTHDIGRSDVRFDDIYATNGTIQTSDRNEKQDIEALSEAEQRVAVAAKGLLRKFRWISSVEDKGEDARIHFGIIAQDLQAAFEAEGLDAGRYAMFTSNTWTDEETGEERTRLGVRYSELLAFIISAI